MSKKGITLIWMIALVLTGCTTIPLYPIFKERIMVADFDSTWQATLAALEEEDFPLDFISKEKGIIETKSLTISDKETKTISQGYMSVFKDPSEGEYNLKVTVKRKDPGRISVRIDTYIRAFFPKYGWYVKSSSGVLENKIFSNIMDRLGQRQILHNWF